MTKKYRLILAPDYRKLRILFYSCWLILGLLQAGFTPLLYDEAYYWLFSFQKSWGHFYYPPLIDPLIRAGYELFHNQLGVRLFFVILSTAGIFLLERLLLIKDLKLFYALMLSIVFFQVTSILAAPDIPLFFLSVTFYLLFRKFLESDRQLYAVLLALNTALLLFTKYHGILLIGFTFLFNFRYLIKKWKTLTWILISILFFVPHIIWQIENGFPTIKFHLFERPGGGFFEWKNLLDYIPGQLLFAGPLISILLVIALIKVRTVTRFEKTLYFNLLAMYAFFFLVSVYHHVEINWTVIGIPPLIILSHKALSEKVMLRKWIYRLLPYSIALALIFRIFLIFPHWMKDSRLDQELYGYKEWAGEIKSEAKGKPVVFSERYQRVSQYAFYSGDSVTFTLNPTQKSDFDYADFEEKIQGKDVLFVSRNKMDSKMQVLNTVKGPWYYITLENFRSYKKFTFNLEYFSDPGSDSIKFQIKPENPYLSGITFEENQDMKTMVGYQLIKNGEVIEKNRTYAPAPAYLKDGIFCIPADNLEKGEYSIILTLKTGWLPEYPVSRYFKFLI